MIANTKSHRRYYRIPYLTLRPHCELNRKKKKNHICTKRNITIFVINAFRTMDAKTRKGSLFKCFVAANSHNFMHLRNLDTISIHFGWFDESSLCPYVGIFFLSSDSSNQTLQSECECIGTGHLMI